MSTLLSLLHIVGPQLGVNPVVFIKVVRILKKIVK